MGFESKVDCFVKIFKYENKPFVQFIWICILVASSCLTFFFHKPKHSIIFGMRSNESNIGCLWNTRRVSSSDRVWYKIDPALGDEYRKLMGLNINQMVYNSIDCTSSLHWYWSYDYGNCFQFNVGQNVSNQKNRYSNSQLRRCTKWFANWHFPAN